MRVNEYISDFVIDISRYRKEVNFGSLRRARAVNAELAKRYGYFHFNIARLTFNGKPVGYGIMKGTSRKLISVSEI